METVCYDSIASAFNSSIVWLSSQIVALLERIVSPFFGWILLTILTAGWFIHASSLEDKSLGQIYDEMNSFPRKNWTGAMIRRYFKLLALMIATWAHKLSEISLLALLYTSVNVHGNEPLSKKYPEFIPYAGVVIVGIYVFYVAQFTWLVLLNPKKQSD